jgi:hypothetical protein
MSKNIFTSIEKTRITVIAIVALLGVLLGISAIANPGETILPGEVHNQALSQTNQTVVANNTAETKSKDDAVVASSVEPFNYEDYTYTAFWYRWILVDGKQTTEPLFRPGLSYESCLASLYCNPDIEQGRVLKDK